MDFRFDRLPTGSFSRAEAITLALQYCNAGALGFARHIGERVLVSDPKNTKARLLLGIVAHKAQDNAAAAAVIAELLRDCPDFTDAHFHHGTALYHEGRLDEAAAAFLRAVELRPGYAEALSGLAEIRLRQGREAEAYALFHEAVTIKPNCSAAYVGHARLRFDRSLPPGETLPPRRTAPPGQPRLSMASLANYGRFAQTVNEYVAVRLYAETHGQGFETPDWVGHRFFALDDPLLDPATQARFEDWMAVRDRFKRSFEGEEGAEPFRDRDLFLGGSPVNAMRRAQRERILSWLTPRPAWRPFLDPVVAAARARGRTLVAVHIRQTDWWDKDKPGDAAYTPLSLYLSWLERIWPELDDPALFVCSDEPRVLAAFDAYRPFTARDYPVRWEGLEYLQDFHLLTQADVMAVSTGSFATTAAALNRNVRLLLRPNRDDSALEPFDPWE